MPRILFMQEGIKFGLLGKNFACSISDLQRERARTGSNMRISSQTRLHTSSQWFYGAGAYQRLSKWGTESSHTQSEGEKVVSISCLYPWCLSNLHSLKPSLTGASLSFTVFCCSAAIRLLFCLLVALCCFHLQINWTFIFTFFLPFRFKLSHFALVTWNVLQQKDEAEWTDWYIKRNWNDKSSFLFVSRPRNSLQRVFADQSSRLKCPRHPVWQIDVRCLKYSY